MRAVPAGSLLVVLLQVGCGGGSGVVPDQMPDAGDDGAQAGSGDGGDDAPMTSDSSQDDGPPLAEGACNYLQPGDSFVQPIDSGVTPAPAAEGGTLVSGVYHLVSTTYYPARSCGRDPLATTLTVDAASMTSGTLQLAGGVASGLAFTESIRYASAGTLLSAHIDCFHVDPGGIQGSAALISYTASATEVQLIINSPGCGYSVDSYQM